MEGRLPLWHSAQPRSKYRISRAAVAFVGLIIVLSTLNWTIFSRRRIQYQYGYFSSGGSAQPERLRAVKKEFFHAWYGYKDHAWMADSLMPVSGTKRNDFCGWSATLIDSLDTLWIMDLKEEFAEALEATLTIDFVKSADFCDINTFESTIRYVGGLLAAYDLSGDARLIRKLKELGELLHMAFNSPNGLPCSHCDLSSNRGSKITSPVNDVPLADVGSFYLEFARLAQVTGDARYMQTVQSLTKIFEEVQDNSSIPGLWPERLDATDLYGEHARFVRRYHDYSLGALSDSAYEYLVKTHLLIGGLTRSYKTMWLKASHQIRRFMLFRAYIPQWNTTDALFSGVISRKAGSKELTLETRTQHLACFAGGMFAMAGRIFNEPADLQIGAALTRGCVWAYENSPSGIMPETFSLLACPDVDAQCVWNETAWCEARAAKSYFDVKACHTDKRFPPGYLDSIDARYILRPEAIESVFIMYRITGDEYWREAGWRMFQSIIKYTRTQYGHTSLYSVLMLTNQTVLESNGQVSKLLPMQVDEMQSFWLAETLKYFWLLFSDASLINLDEWVLNTEAHPLRLTRTRGF